LSHGERETIVIYVESSGYTTEYFGLTREKKLVKIIGRRFRCIKDGSLVISGIRYL
jgi:hypothetical protein